MTNAQIVSEFIKIYGGKAGDVRLFTAPGRVNLIGEHTDYNGGFVLPAALDMGTVVAVRKRDDRTINLAATDLDVRVSAEIDNLEQYKEILWGNYQLGVASELQKAGYNVCGCDMLFHITIPPKSGLSSSASIDVATAVALATLSSDKPVNLVEMAVVAQKAENNYIGVNCGIMDQFISALGKKDHAIFLNCKTLEYEAVPVNLGKYSLVIGNTNKRRGLGDSKYNERRAECDEGLDALRGVIPHITCLSDVTVDQFLCNQDFILNDTTRSRVEHVIMENDRVAKAALALKSGDVAQLGALMTESHNSLRDLYEVTGIELDTMVEEALKIDGTIGSRMTGAGFGGCTVSIVDTKKVVEFVKTVGQKYEEKVGICPDFYVCKIENGAAEIENTVGAGE